MDRVIFIGAIVAALAAVASLLREGYDHLTLAVALTGLFFAALYAGRVGR